MFQGSSLPTTLAIGKTGRLNRCRTCGKIKRTECTCPKQTRKPTAAKRVKRSKRYQIAENSESEDNRDSDESSPEDAMAFDSACESDDHGHKNEVKEEGNSDSDSEDSVEFDCEEEGNDSQDDDFQPRDVEVPPYDTSTLRSRSSSLAQAKNFPSFDTKQSRKVGPANIANDIISPLEYLSLFWDDDAIMNTFVTNTNKYGVKLHGKSWKNVIVSELWVFFVIVLFSGMYKVPNRRLMWDDTSGKFASKFVKSLMTRTRFEDLLRCLHWKDSSQYSVDQIKQMNGEDSFWRVSELTNMLATRFQQFYVCDQYIDGDEQGIPAKCRHTAIQYNGDKPHKYFFKLYCLNDSKSKYMHNFYLFRGKDSDSRPGISASSLPIVKLTDADLYHDKNYIMYVDNYFNSIGLCNYLLYKRGIHTVGTLRINRIPKELVPKDWWFKKSKKIKRGSMKSRQIEQNLFVTTWYDKKPVQMLHTFASTREQVDRNTKNPATSSYQKLRIQRPRVISAYNAGMGGTDSFDQRLSYYRPSINTKRWPHRIIFHMLECSIINSHILYKEVNNLQKHDELYDLFGFIDALIDEILSLYKPGESSGADEGSDDELIEHNPVRYPSSSHEKVTEQANHVPYCLPALQKGTRISNRKRCAAIGCKNKVSSFCSHCQVALCLDLEDGTNCWRKYHEL